MSNWKFRFTNAVIRLILGLIVKADLVELDKVPKTGPLILVSNHTNFIEVPLVFTHLQPRPVTGFAKAETWDDPLLGRLFDIWGGIPIHRGEADLSAIKKAIEMLQKGYIIGMTPEGTRTNTGVLIPGQSGVCLLALHSGAPLQPLVYYGHERYRDSLKRLRRSDFHVRVGPIFHLRKPAGRVTSEIRQEMTEEIMYQLAKLMPERFRGVYSDLSKASTNYLQFD
jgi:1-acyl-sn-glycerol-3-phosphate acyltransferase